MKKNLCQCGCGNPLPLPSRQDRNPRFIKGHYSKTAAFRRMRKRNNITPPSDWTPPSGICECGCGGKTELVTLSNQRLGIWAGYPRRFIHNHHRMGITGERHPRWKGGRVDDGQGHVLIRVKGGYKPEHRMVWEAAHGPIPPKHHIHHVNGIPDDNRLENLVCLTPRQHKLTHQHTEGAHHGHISDDELISAYRKLWTKLGRPPYTGECTGKNGTPEWSTYARRFHSVHRLRELAKQH